MEQINGEIAVLEEEKPTHTVMQKLSALYTVRDHMVLGAEPVTPATASVEVIPTPEGELSEFMQFVSGKSTRAVMSIIDELMDVLQTTNPKLYNGVLQKIWDGV